MTTILLAACHYIPARRKLCPKVVAQEEAATKERSNNDNNVDDAVRSATPETATESKGEEDDFPEATREDAVFGDGFFVMHVVCFSKSFFYFLSATMLHEGICDASEHSIFAQAPTSDFATRLGFSSDCPLEFVLERITRNKRFLKDVSICCVSGQSGVTTTGPKAQITINDVVFSERLRELIYHECPFLEKIRVRCVQGLDYDEEVEKSLDNFLQLEDSDNDDDVDRDDDGDVDQVPPEEKQQRQCKKHQQKIKPLLHLLNFNREVLETHPLVACRGNAARFIGYDLLAVCMETNFEREAPRIRQVVFESLEKSRKSFIPNNGDASLIRCIAERVATDNFKDSEALGDYFYALTSICELENSSKRYLLLPLESTFMNSFAFNDSSLAPNVSPLADYAPCFDFLETLFINGDERFLRGNVEASSQGEAQILVFLNLIAKFLYLGRMGTEKNFISYHMHPCFVRKAQFVHRYGETLLLPLFKFFSDKNRSIPTLSRSVDVDIVYWLTEIASDVKYEYSWDDHGHGIYDADNHPRWSAGAQIFIVPPVTSSSSINNNNLIENTLAFRMFGARIFYFVHLRTLIARESLDFETRLASYLYFFGDENWIKWIDDSRSNNQTLQHYPLREYTNIMQRIMIGLEAVHPTLISAVVDCAQNAFAHVATKKQIDHEVERRGNLLIFSTGFLRDFFGLLRVRRSNYDECDWSSRFVSAQGQGDDDVDGSKTIFLLKAQQLRQVFVSANKERILSKNENDNSDYSSSMITHVLTPVQQLFTAKIVNKFGSLVQDDLFQKNEWLAVNPKCRTLFWKEMMGMNENNNCNNENYPSSAVASFVPINSIMEYMYLNFALVDEIITELRQDKTLPEENNNNCAIIIKLPNEIQTIIKTLGVFTRVLQEAGDGGDNNNNNNNNNGADEDAAAWKLIREKIKSVLSNQEFAKMFLQTTESSFETIANIVQMEWKLLLDVEE